MASNSVNGQIAAVLELTEMQAVHFSNLIEKGFTRKEALTLTQTYLEHQMMMTQSVIEINRRHALGLED